MGTIVSFHAHPDDESIGTGGTLARASDAGHRVVLVLATRGELGEPVPGVLDEGEQLTLRRTAEVFESAAILGVHRVEFLGYTDSGMAGDPTNDAPWCFAQADVEHAARRLAVILGEEQPDVLTVYDDDGGYGHPDHIQVHRVGIRAAELVGVPVVAQGTINRDVVREAMARAGEMGVDVPEVAVDDQPPANAHRRRRAPPWRSPSASPRPSSPTWSTPPRWWDASVARCWPTPARSGPTTSWLPCPMWPSPSCSATSGTWSTTCRLNHRRSSPICSCPSRSGSDQSPSTNRAIVK
jgi:LmbE family N-acetylglucosaminyl deacetylase